MIPLRSSERTYTTPYVTLALIIVNVVMFIFEARQPEWSLNRFIAVNGIVPYRFRPISLLTSMFLHGGWFHLLGNMWFLWLFGKNIEDVLGHLKFLLFYLICGIVAGIVHVYTNIFSMVPTIGASGAIAGVMGAYLLKFPRAHIVTLVPILIFITTFDIPAAFLLIYWFLIQFFSGFGSIGYSQVSSSNVAFFAHVGGFVAGMLLIKVIPSEPRPRQWSYR